MNAKWLEKFSKYRLTNKAHDLIRLILNEKIRKQCKLSKLDPETYLITETDDKKMYFIKEAIVAKKYWTFWENNLGAFGFTKREPHGKDNINQLIDVGYHFLTSELTKKMSTIDVPTELGILHKARNKKSNPLVYDLIEWLRPIVVDQNIFHILHAKKKISIKLDKEIPRVIVKIKKSLEKSFYNKNRGQCIKLSYWIDLYLLEFRNAVSENRYAKFNFPPIRHDMRCSKKKSP